MNNRPLGIHRNSTKKETWGERRATKLFNLCKANTPLEEVYKAFPTKTIKYMNNKIHMMGFSVKKLKEAPKQN